MSDKLNLQNALNVTILGSGTCVPSLKRSSCSVLVETKKAKILLDSGPGTMKRLLEVGVSIWEITHIYYSHFHPDHTGELVSFLFSTKYPKILRNSPITITAGTGFIKFYDMLRDIYGSWIELEPEMLRLKEMDNSGPSAQLCENFSVDSIPVSHNKESLAYRITLPCGISMVYSGDTDYCENLIKIAKDTDLFICESALPDDMKVSGHLTPSLAGDIATKANVRKLVLTHLYPECDKTDIKAQCRKTYQGPLFLAEDLMRIPLA
ncbi:ribonuclease Z [Candidatus Magnetomoraceae bacterium gMMP-15]